MPNYTLTHSEIAKGWTSFFSFVPEMMVGMNNHFFTFKGGNLYRHNTNEVRNNFYGQQFNSRMTSVFNDAPLDNKLFKTLNLESDDTWAATMITDVQDSGFIQIDWFEKKEASYFGFVRNQGSIPANIKEYPLRSLNGIGRSASVVGTNDVPIIRFAVTIEIGSIISIGDIMYFAVPPYTAPQLAGRITAITVNLQAGTNQITLDAFTGSVKPIPIQDAYFLFIKNAVAESHGVLGHYCVFELTNTSTSATELFAAESEVMKSYP
jgi:hypothetical protein